MMETIFVFIPDTLNLSQIGKLEGVVENSNGALSFYIINDKALDAPTNIIGFCSDNSPNLALSIGLNNNSAWIHINNKSRQITVNGLKDTSKITCIAYDYNSFKKSDINTFQCKNYGEHFETLTKTIQEQQLAKNGHTNIGLLLPILTINFILGFVNLFHKICNRLHFLICYSVTAVHLYQTIDTVKWALITLRQKRKITLTVGNIIVSKLTDFLCGLTLLYFIVQHEVEFITFLQDMTESIIQALEQLLNFLMGSPVGLKLNFAFNKTLGTFFLYHIALWRAFLHATSPLLQLALHLLIIPGAFGLSFQAALISDLVAFSTFHVYCIYVYAARFYGVQIKGLVSLWRLFIGRKYNPLRKRVDSHQYTHHQLFIGTLAFTVLLFLLPTTFLYYAVFTVFRITLIALDGLLLRLRYCLQCFPIYVTALWMINSPCVRGAVKLTICTNHPIEKCSIYATLQTLSLWQSIVNTSPNTLLTIHPTSWKFLFQSVAMGLLL